MVGRKTEREGEGVQQMGPGCSGCVSMDTAVQWLPVAEPAVCLHTTHLQACLLGNMYMYMYTRHVLTLSSAPSLLNHFNYLAHFTASTVLLRVQVHVHVHFPIQDICLPSGH